MSQIIVKRKELERAFNRHISIYRSVQEGKSSVHLLLLFYSVECGLKALILKHIKKNTTEDLNNFIDLSKHGHNINKLLKELLKLHSSPQFHHMSFPALPYDRSKSATVSQYNQVWRYGVNVNKEKEDEAENLLLKLANWIGEEI